MTPRSGTPAQPHQYDPWQQGGGQAIANQMVANGQDPTKLQMDGTPLDFGAGSWYAGQGGNNSAGAGRGPVSAPVSTPQTPGGTPTTPQTPQAPAAPYGGGGAAVPEGGSTLPGGIQQQLNTSNVPGLVSGNNLSGAMQQAQDAAYKQATGYLDPQWNDASSKLQSQLVNQGIPQNSEAWNKAMGEFNRSKQFAYGQAQNAAVGQGNAAQAQLFGQGLQANQNQFGQNLAGGQFGNAAQSQYFQQLLGNNQFNEGVNQNNFNNSMQTRQQGINELLLQQQNPLQMYQALMQGNSIQQPNFTQTPGANIGGTDLASIIQNALGQQNSVYNTQVGSQNSQTAGWAGIIAALMSDRRFKKNIRCVGMHEVGVPLYTFDYLWGEPGMGVMADELERVKPEAVFDFDGIKVVDYARL